jgi:hypothetical protein
MNTEISTSGCGIWISRRENWEVKVVVGAYCITRLRGAVDPAASR